MDWKTAADVILGEILILQTEATLIRFSFSGSFSKYKEQQVFHHLWDRFLCGLANFQVSMAFLWPTLLQLSLLPSVSPGITGGSMGGCQSVFLLSVPC